jgi:polyphenol oxidase
MKLLFPNWPAPTNIKAYCTTRIGGCSEAPFNELNLAHHVGDDAEHVRQNRELLKKELNLKNEPAWLSQVHGIDAINLKHHTQGIKADASFTTEPEQVCIVMTADCLPLLVCNNQGSEVAAVHAGWRGLLAGVIDNTIQQLTSKAEDLLVWLGPAIGPKHFELNEDIHNQFIQRQPQFSQGFFQRDNSIYADIYQLARINLQQLGVTAIYGGDYCSYSQADLFYSYRRNKGNTGRMASLIYRQI